MSKTYTLIEHMQINNGIHVTCEECIYWESITGKSEKRVGGAWRYQKGLCRRYAPKPIVQDHDDLYLKDKIAWPITLFNDFCGELIIEDDSEGET